MGAALPIIALAAGGIGTAVSAFGSIQQAHAQAAAARYNSEVAANNATIAKQNATYAGQAGEQQVATQGQKTKAAVGAIKAAQAASGVDVNSGSAVDVRSSAAETGQLDALTIRSNAVRQAYGYKVQAASDTAQSQLDKFTAQNDISAGYMNAGSTLLGGVSDTYNNYLKYKQAGAF